MSNGDGLRRVLITGAAGSIGRVVRAGLRDHYALRLLDRAAQEPAGDGEEVITADIGDLDALVDACEGVDGVVHLAGIPAEDRFSAIAEANITGTAHVLEAARRQGVGRAVLASSNHVTGFHPISAQRIGPDAEPRPDTFYGVSKLALEGLGCLYAEKFGLEVACLRIGSFGERAHGVRSLSTWLSHRDAVQLVVRCLEAPDLGFTILYGISGNSRAWWDLSAAHALGYEPQDDAEAYAQEVLADAGADVDPGVYQGGSFTDVQTTLEHVEYD
ncbi:MAG: NAD-dependent epimerase/dehydratase family protein [Egibacteraceae bacterium]